MYLLLCYLYQGRDNLVNLLFCETCASYKTQVLIIRVYDTSSRRIISMGNSLFIYFSFFGDIIIILMIITIIVILIVLMYILLPFPFCIVTKKTNDTCVKLAYSICHWMSHSGVMYVSLINVSINKSRHIYEFQWYESCFPLPCLWQVCLRFSYAIARLLSIRQTYPVCYFLCCYVYESTNIRQNLLGDNT